VNKAPGLYCHPLVLGRDDMVHVSTAVKSTTLRGSSVPDLRGSPMNVSAIINYMIVDPIKAQFAVDNLEEYLENQGLEVLKNVCA